VPKRKRIRPVGIVVVPRTKKDQERRDALSPREAFKRKAEEKAQKGKEQEMLRDLLRKQKKPKEPETKYPIRRVPKTRKKPPTSRRI